MFKRFYITRRQDDCFYRDLRRFADDRTVLTNPHKGWYLHFIDNGIRRKEYREDISGPEDILNIPGMKILYIRLDWLDIEAQEGVFDWSYVDNIVNTYKEYGYKFALRFCTYEGFGETAVATPMWVFDKGAKYNLFEKRGLKDRPYCKMNGDFYEPVYDDPIFKECLERFIKECGRKFNGKDFVEWVDIGTFGTFGEGHTYGGSQKVYPFETLKWHIDLHVKNFPDTRLVVNDDMITQLYGEDGNKYCRYLADYCRGLNMGITDDSINVEYFSQAMGYDTLRTPELFDMFKGNAPVDLEFEHYGGYGAIERFEGGYRHIEALKHTGASYAGFHGYVTKWYAEQKDMHNYLANRLGYWYFVNGFSLVDLTSGTTPILSVDIENKGFARAYDKFIAKVVLVNEKGEENVVFEGDSGNEGWLPEKEANNRYQLSLKGIEKGEYKLYFGLFEKDTAIKLALCDELLNNGMYLLDTVTVN